MVDSVPFGQVCRLFERVEATKGSSRKQDLFASFFKSVPALLTENAFPLLRLLVPKFDREKTYGISAKKIAAIYIQANSWPPHGEKASRLTQWADKKQGNKSEGVSNFTNVLEGILKEEGLTVDSGWTVAQINSLLAELNELTNIADRISLWRRLALELTSATQHKWLMRIILKDLKLGIGETTILSVFHPSALEWYNNTSDLQLVCSNVIETGESQPHRSSVTAISPENPIRPMLAARAVWSDIEERITNGRWAVELKFDGERCLIHKSNGVFRLFSRNQLELSTRYPDYLTSMETLFQTHIMASSCIIDGEILAWDESRAGFASFGTNRSVASGLVENCSLAYMAFDIVYMNGKVLVDLPLEERQKVLSACIPNGIPNRFEVAKKEVITSAEQVITALDCAIEQSNEGLILKNLDSVYSVNARDKDSWMKIKADYLLNDSMCDTMDLIILGAYLGKRGGGGYTSFLLGLANGQNRDGEGYPKTFFTFSKVGSGFTQDELALLLERIEPYFEKFDKAAIPSWFEPLSPQFPAPDAIIDPKFSAVLEIKGFEISAGSRHSSGYNIRFPTTIRVRNDKFWHECWTVDDVAEIVRSSSGGRLCHSVRESLFARAHSPRRVRKTPGTTASLLASLPTLQLGRISKKSSLLDGLNFHVRSSTIKYSTADMQRLIIENGGTVVVNFTKDSAQRVDFVIVGDKTVNVENLITQASTVSELDVNILHFQWVIDSIARNEVLLFFPWYWLRLNNQTKVRMKSVMDVDTGIVWGCRPDPPQCRQIYTFAKSRHCSAVDSVDEAVLRQPGLKRFRNLLGHSTYDLLWTPSTMFRDVVAYIFPLCSQEASHGSPCWKTRSMGNLIRVYSGIVRPVFDDVTHIFMCHENDFTEEKVQIVLKKICNGLPQPKRDSLVVVTKALLDKLIAYSCQENVFHAYKLLDILE